MGTQNIERIRDIPINEAMRRLHQAAKAPGKYELV